MIRRLTDNFGVRLGLQFGLECKNIISFKFLPKTCPSFYEHLRLKQPTQVINYSVLPLTHSPTFS